MDGLDWPLKFILSFVLGAVIGLEREINEKKEILGDSKEKTAVLGLRSFALTAGLGTVCGVLYGSFPILSVALAGALLLLLLAFYSFDSFFTRDYGFTTELAAFYTFAIGFLIAIEVIPVQLVIAISVVIVLLMSRKEKIKNIVEDIRKSEINAFVSFAILAFVILPFLPNQTYTISNFGNLANVLENAGISFGRLANLELFNPFKLWFIVVLITGIDLGGYVLERTFGARKGWLITSLAGGFVSSTATTISIAQESKTSGRINALLSGAVFANFISFVPIAFLLITLNAELFASFFPALLAILLSLCAVGFYFLRRAKMEASVGQVSEKIKRSHHIFNLTAALKFMGIFLAINIASKVAIEFFGGAGLFIATFFGAFTGIDAVVINIAQLTGGSVSIGVGVWALVLANAVNLIAKSIYSYLQGSKAFATRFFVSVVVVILLSVFVPIFFFSLF